MANYTLSDSQQVYFEEAMSNTETKNMEEVVDATIDFIDVLVEQNAKLKEQIKSLQSEVNNQPNSF